MAMSRHTDDPLPSVRFKSDDPAAPPLPCPASAFLRGSTERGTGRFLLWNFRSCFQIYSLVWSGIRTRDTRFIGPMLYPTELSSGGRTGFEPVADGLHRCSTSELPSSRNTFFHASAYATARPRAPDGIASRTAVACSIDVPYCRLSPTGNAYRRLAPCALQTQPRAARVEASPRGAHAPVAAALLPRARSIAAPGCFRAESFFHGLVLPNSCAACASFANAGNKTPPGLATRGRSRCLGRSGWPISQGVRP